MGQIKGMTFAQVIFFFLGKKQEKKLQYFNITIQSALQTISAALLPRYPESQPEKKKWGEVYV